MAKCILIVDDSATMIMSVRSTLEMNGFVVETAGDGVIALNKLKGGLKPDLIITDVNMPNMGGLDLIRHIKTLPGFRFVPILTLTTESDAAKRDEGKKLGATGWLVKPVSGSDLVKVIKQVVPGA
jgi:two-component system chemotaxis response regulator CheY